MPEDLMNKQPFPKSTPTEKSEGDIFAVKESSRRSGTHGPTAPDGGGGKERRKSPFGSDGY